MLQNPVPELLSPARVWSRTEVLARDCPVPREPGVYAWYFDSPPPGVPTTGCICRGDMTLLYVGISPKQPPQNGRPPSRQHLRRRIRYHFRGNAAGSTLRLTLGCLLGEELGIRLQTVGNGRLTFGEGEQALSDWMGRHAFVTWVPDAIPWVLESELIKQIVVPLNLLGNDSHPFHAVLRETRRRARANARESQLGA